MSATPTLSRLLAETYAEPCLDEAPAGPQSSPGEIINWPMLKLCYRTDADKIAALLPPGIEPGKEPHVYVTLYNFPVHNEPEYGVVVNVAADYDGQEGEYTCLLYTSPSPRDATLSRMPSSA